MNKEKDLGADAAEVATARFAEATDAASHAAPTHTPRPWRWNHNSELWAGSQPVIELADDGACGDPECCGPAHYYIQVGIEDAHLIAAAPELLEALKEIVSRNEIQHWFNLDQARAAIEKAEGRS